MKLSFSFFWTAILLVSVLVSCTIEKRLYQPGYHVEWNKRARSVNETEAVAEKQVLDQHIQADEKNTKMIPATPALEKTMVAVEETPVLSQTQDRVSNTTENSTVTNTASSDQQTETLDETLKRKSTLKKASHRPGSQSSRPFLRGLLLVLIGLLLIGIGLLFNSALGVFGTVLLVIFGLGGAIMVIVGLFVMTFG